MLHERERAIEDLCDGVVAQVADAMPDADVTCVLRVGNVLRQVAHRGSLRAIYEFPRHLGGVVWRAVELDATQIVPDVRRDPDYIAVDTSVRSEVAAPVRAGETVVAVLNAESSERELGDADARTLEAAAEQLGEELSPIYDS